MRAFGVVEAEPRVEVGLEGCDGFVELFAQGHGKKLIIDGAMEAFHKAISIRMGDLGAAMLHAIERQVQLKRVGVRATELAPIIG